MRSNASENEACRYIIDLVYDRCRVKLHDGKEQLIRSRLGKRMRHLGLPSLVEYVDFLREQADEDEFTRVVDALTTNFTHFLREPDHFDYTIKHALPQMLAKGQKSFRIWSAACSSGEEPYSIAMYLAENYPPGLGWDWRITASDISTKVLALAKRGIYPEDRIANVPVDWRRRHFQRGVGEWEGQVRVKPDLAGRVSFRQVNLTDTYDHPCTFEIVYCRNVMIYFDRPTQEQLVNRLCRFLAPKGFLLIGHSESLNGLKVPVRCLKPSIYQRV